MRNDVRYGSLDEFITYYRFRSHEGLLVIDKLREVLDSDEEILDVINVIINICPHCYDAEFPCYCSMDW
jgi:hypothetical protein